MKPVHWILLGLVTLGTLGLDHLAGDHPPAHAWERIPLFAAAFGFLGCVAIVVVSKALGKLFLQQPEDYYERDADRDG